MREVAADPQLGPADNRHGAPDATLEAADAQTTRLSFTTAHTQGTPRPQHAAPEIGPMPQTPEVELEETPQERRAAAVTANHALPQRDVLNHANFGLLPEDPGRKGSFGVAVGVNIAIVALILGLTINQVQEAKVHRQETLVYVTPPPKPYVPPVPKVVLPPIPPLPKEEVKIPPVPKPVIEPPTVELPKIAAKAPALPAPAPRPVATPPKPVVGAFKAPTAPAAQTQRVAQTQTAGFGNPTGVQANPNANRPSQLANVGGFGAASNSNTGAAARQGAVTTAGFGAGAPSGSPNGSARGVVAAAGFGEGTRPAGTPGGHGTISTAGFGAGTQAGGTPGGHGTIASAGFGQGKPAAGAVPARAQQAETTPIVVLSKPLPQYTAEAREAHVQGDVTLEVRFTADGQVQVLRVINGLGHGLDEQARVAASKIRFKPSTRDGKPVDQVAVIHISFQLA